MALREGKHEGEPLRAHGVVGVEIGDETPPRRRQRCVPGRPVAASGPSGGNLPEARVGAVQHGRVVLAIVGGKHHLDVVERLAERAPDRLADRLGGLETRDQNADGRC